jgi:two-component system cell cycle sensor histidine kinase/response regulator CckA
MNNFRLDPELFSDSGLGLVVYAPDADAMIEYCNAVAARWFGCTRAELEGRRALDLSWSFLDAAEQPMPREHLPVFVALASGQVVHAVQLGILVVDNESPLWVRVCAVPQRGATGEIERVVTMLEEITAEVNSRKVDARMSRLLEVAFESADEGLLVSNEDGSSVRFNQAYGRISRISSTEGITSLAALRRVMTGIHVSGQPMALDEWPLVRALRGETGEVEATSYRPGTNNAWIGIYRYAPLHDGCGRITGAVVVCRNITRKRELENSLAVSEHRFKALADGAPDGIFIRTKGIFTYVNSALLKMLALADASEFLGTSSFDWVAPEYFKARQVMEKAVMNGEVSPPSFRELLARDGTRVPVETAGAMLDQDSYVGFVRDVRARLAAEAQQSKLREEVERSRRMESIGNLAGGVAHDFNNVLQAQKLFLALMKVQLEGRTEEFPMLEEIESCTDKASALISQLLAFGRKQLGNPAVIDLNVTLLKIESLLKSSVGEDVIFHITPATTALWVNVDPGQLEQIMLNLVLNARDAMPEGGQLRIRLTDEANDKSGLPQALVSVVDTGIGMDDDTRQRIFEPFFTTKPAAQNGGLGLASVYALVEQNSGQIRVSSRLGEGTEFEIRFPLVTSLGPSAPQPDVCREQTTACRSRRVLLVEDEESLREITKRVLEQLGHQVLAAANGATALWLVEQLHLPPQLLITDLIMPEMNGRELAQRLRERFAGLRVIYVSGHTEGLISRNGVLDSDVNFLAKPFSAEQLLQMIASLGEGC